MAHRHPNLGEIDRILRRARHPETIAFLNHYRGIHPIQRLPSPAALDLASQPLLQRHCVTLTVEGRFDPQNPAAAMDFRITAVGPEISKASRYPLAGRRLGEIAADDDPDFRYVVAITGEVVRSRQPIYYFGPTRLNHPGGYVALEYCSCPLSDDGVTVDAIVCFMLFLAGDTPGGD